MNALISCKTCGLIQQLDHLPRGHQAECARCGEIILRYQPLSSALTAAFSLAALFLYVPANNYPVLSMHYLGRQTENTVWAESGSCGATECGEWPVVSRSIKSLTAACSFAGSFNRIGLAAR